MEKENNFKDHLMIFSGFGVLVLGCGLLVASLILPPPGIIDNSVLVAFGETLTFSGAVFGIGINRKINRRNEKNR